MTTATKDITDILFERVGFAPYPNQELVLRCGCRYILVAGGEQAGKSLTASKFFLSQLPNDLLKAEANKEVALYWLVADDYDGVRREYDYIVDDLIALFGEKNVDYSKVVNPGHIDVKTGDNSFGIRVETKSGQDQKKLRMNAPYGIIVCEASTVELGVYTRVMGRTAPRRGWAFFSGTFEEGSVGWYPQVFKSWKDAREDRMSFSLATTDNISLYEGGMNDPEIQRLKGESSDDWFLERIMGQPVPPKGLVFPEFRPDLHVKDVEYVPGNTVYLWEDPGYGSDSAHALLAAHLYKKEQLWYVEVFDEIYERGKITDEIITIAEGRPWWKERKVLVSDPNYKDAHHSMTSVAEIWMAKTGLVAFGTKGRINAGTERMKSFLKYSDELGRPRIVFNPTCRGILSEFGAGPSPLPPFTTKPYRWRIDNDGETYGTTPDDKNNHSIKAVIYGLIEEFGNVEVVDRDQIKVTRYAKRRRG